MKERLIMVQVTRIKVGKHEQRMEEDPDVFAELVSSIGRNGLINPISVKQDGESFILVAGHRRLAAIKKLGYPEVLCMVRQSSENLDEEITFAENFCRKSLTPIEQAGAIKDCYTKGVMSVKQLAKAFHRTENWVAGQMAMVEWPEDVLSAIHQELISVSAARNLAVITDDAYRGFLLETAVSSGATARSTAAWLQGWQQQKSAELVVETEVNTGGPPQAAIIPRMPCLCCATVLRMDQMSHVPICQDCIKQIRNVAAVE